MKNFIKTFGFLIGAFLLILGSQQVIKFKFVNDSTRIVNGFYSEEKNSVDVLVLGPSSAFCSINPLVLYEEYGITGYDFCASSQTLDVTYYYLKEALKYQNPKVVVVEVGMASYDNQNEGFRWSYGDTRMSLDKLQAIYQSIGKLDYEYLSYVFPILEYKERWKILTETDFSYPLSDKWDYAKGYMDTDIVSEEPIDLSGYEVEGVYNLSDKNIKSLNDILELCEENNIGLILIKAPTANWDSSLTKAIQQYADDKNVSYIDYNSNLDETGINLEKDFRNAAHLNNSGAAKLTMNLGKYICDNYDIPDRRDELEENSWDRSLKYWSGR